MPAISDDVVEQVLTKLLLLDGQILSYRALDVEQIGSVYEGIMGFMVEKATGPSVGITYRPPRQKITITVVVDADQLVAQPGTKRERWLEEQAGVALKLPAKAKEGLKQARSLAELCLALGNRLSPHTPNGLAKGSLILQPTAERRRSGSHYTPRALTEPIVAEAFRPWLERCNHQPTAEEILALKVCDPAMGSGAFLVAVCRFLADWLVQGWERDGYPDGFRQEWDKVTVARRLIAQSCLYGVDKNPFAVNLAKLSLWLVTLSKELPFTFVDHALKCGDSLVGYSVQEIRAAIREVQLGFLDDQNRIYEQMGIDRRESFAFDSLTDADYDTKKLRLEHQIKATEGLRQAGDLMVAAFFAKTKPKERADKQQVYLAMLSGTFQDEGLEESVEQICTRLAGGDKGISPFHWDLEFPEVFGEGRNGFDVFVGNPPFIAKNAVSQSFHASYPAFLLERFNGTTAKCDICGFFFRKLFELCREKGALALIATNTISQGDTRESSLEYICVNEGIIYRANPSFRWPGVAAVVASSVTVHKRGRDLHQDIQCFINKKKVDRISSYLLPNCPDIAPKALERNQGIAFQGCNISGQGFLFSDSSKGSWPVVKMKELISSSSKVTEVLAPYMGGEDLNSEPSVKPARTVIRLGKMSLEEARENYPEIVRLLESSVKPDRESRPGNAQQKALAEKWWQWHTDRPTLWEAVRARDIKRVLCCSAVSTHACFAFISCDIVPSHKLNVFVLDRYQGFALVQSSIHEIWARRFSSTLAQALNYSPTDCFETFPFATGLRDSTAIDRTHEATYLSLEAIGERYYKFRAELMLSHNEGLTSTYNRFHDPSERSTGMLQLRALHQEMDQAVLAAYGWSNVPTACGFDLDYLDTEEDSQLPDELKARIDSGDLFFLEAGDALDFQSQLQAYGAITGRRKLPWRYRWPDAVRDDVLARLLALNAERYAEEVAMGLHSKGAKKATGAKRGRKPKAPAAGEQAGFQLEPEPQQMGFDLSGGR